MKKLVIIPNLTKDNGFLVTDKVVEKLLSLDLDVYMSKSSGYVKDGVHLFDSVPFDADLIIVVGGDGSVIDASSLAIENDVPILGINLGRVGYLAEVEPTGLSVLDSLISGEYWVADKMLLGVEFESNCSCARYAVNDVAISRGGSVNIASIRIEDSNGNVLGLRADGVVLATPQGSTAYSFSSGGPIVAHDVESILLTPISPHSFFNRSVMFNSSDVIKVTNNSDDPLSISADGRNVGVLASGEFCRVKKAAKTIKMLTFTKNSMFSSLVKKMRILGDID